MQMLNETINGENIFLCKLLFPAQRSSFHRPASTQIIQGINLVCKGIVVWASWQHDQAYRNILHKMVKTLVTDVR
jgi:hypothetical protein